MTSVAGDYKLRVEGSYDRLMGGIAFVNETKLTFSQRSMTIFIQTDKPVYMQGDTGKLLHFPVDYKEYVNVSETTIWGQGKKFLA